MMREAWGRFSPWLLLGFVLVASCTGRDPGTIPYDFPVVEDTAALEGEIVLSPNPGMLESVFEQEDGNGVLIWYNQIYVGPNETSPGESILQNSFDTFSMPNSLIIPLGPGTNQVQEGDILLSWWQSGSGMQRCYVVDASDPSRPRVKYLDIELDNPATNSEGIGIGRQTEQLQPNSFSVLSSDNAQAFIPGSAAACWPPDDGSPFTPRAEYGIVISAAENKLLALGFAGRVKSYPIGGCTSIPIQGQFSPGDRVFAPFTADMREATVSSFSAEFGRYFVTFSFNIEEAIPIGDLLAELPDTMAPTVGPSGSPSATLSLLPSAVPSISPVVVETGEPSLSPTDTLSQSPTQLVTDAATSMFPTMLDDDDFPPECLDSLLNVTFCTGFFLGESGTQVCLDCWTTALSNEVSDCLDGQAKFCTNFVDLNCVEKCGQCTPSIFNLTNCIVEAAQECGFDQVCPVETLAPTFPPSTMIPTAEPTGMSDSDTPSPSEASSTVDATRLCLWGTICIILISFLCE